jgi:tetratricopeptide (TPR) repeat protein
MTPCHGLPQILSEKYYGTGVEEKIAAQLDAGLASFQAGALRDAEGSFLRAYGVDPTSTVTNHFLGYLYERLGDYEAAFRHFEISRNMKVGKNGLLPTFNNVLRDKENRARGVFVVDLDRVFLGSSRANGKGFNDELIHDWCHPNKAGHRLIADATEVLLREAFGSARPK